MPKASLSKTFTTRRKNTGEGASSDFGLLHLNGKFFAAFGGSLHSTIIWGTHANEAALLAARRPRGQTRGRMGPEPSEKSLRSR